MPGPVAAAICGEPVSVALFFYGGKRLGGEGGVRHAVNPRCAWSDGRAMPCRGAVGGLVGEGGAVARRRRGIHSRALPLARLRAGDRGDLGAVHLLCAPCAPPPTPSPHPVPVPSASSSQLLPGDGPWGDTRGRRVGKERDTAIGAPLAHHHLAGKTPFFSRPSPPALLSSPLPSFAARRRTASFATCRCVDAFGSAGWVACAQFGA